MSCDWEGKHRSGIALAMRHRLKWFIHLRTQGISKGDEHPTVTPHGVWVLFAFLKSLLTIIMMLATNVSILKLTVACLEQFQPLQL